MDEPSIAHCQLVAARVTTRRLAARVVDSSQQGDAAQASVPARHV